MPNLIRTAAAIGFLAGASVAAQAASDGPDLKDPKRIATGQTQFAQTCAYCHGNAGSGGKAGPIAGRTDLDAEYVHQTISNGKRAGSLVMPAWKESLDPETIWALTAYIMSLQAKP